MKKNLLLIVLGMLCLKFSASAQDNATFKGIKVGDKVPDIEINDIINYPTKTAKISNFKGKLLILDFWATWCSPCVAMMPKMDSLQKVFEGKIQFLPVAYQKREDILAFFKRLEAKKNRKYNLPEAVEDTTLKTLFPHTYLPHYVWISGSGKVLAITGYDEVTGPNIQKLLESDISALKQKNDDQPIPYKEQYPMLVGNNGGDGKNILRHSLLTSYTNGLPSIYRYFKSDSTEQQRIVALNVPLYWFYKVAYENSGDNEVLTESRIVIKVKNPEKINSKLRGDAYTGWMKQNNAFCYELIIPGTSRELAFEQMRADLQQYFPQYKATLKKIKGLCWTLVRTSASDKMRTKGADPVAQFDPFGGRMRNFPLSRFIQQLNITYLQNLSVPIIDKTGYSGFVDLDINAPLNDISAINKELSRYDLEFVLKEGQYNKLFIEDNL